METKLSSASVSNQSNVRATLKWFNAAKGFGFVVPDDNPVDAFLHITQLQEHGVHGLGENAVVICDVEFREKGASVTKVIKIVDAGKMPTAVAVPDPANCGLFKTKGIVKLYSAEKGFGFIIPHDGMKDIFVHKLCLSQCGIDELIPGQGVSLTFKSAPKGREAVSIEIENNI